MRKICFSLFLLCSISSIAFSQSVNIDSLRRVAASGRRDSGTCMAMYQIGKYYYYEKTAFDSSMLYIQQAAAMTKAGHWPLLEASIQNMIGNIYERTGVYNKALESMLIALRDAEKLGNEEFCAKAMNNIGNVYASLGDYPKSIEYTYRAKAIGEKLSSDNVVASCLVNIGDGYYRMGVYDSARVFGEKGYSLALKIKTNRLAGIALGNLGDAYNATGAPEIAIGYYRKAMAFAGTNFIASALLLGMAKAFVQTGHPDSAVLYGRAAFERASSLKLTEDVLSTSTFMADYYKQHGKVDSAYRYLNYLIAAKDSMFSEEKTREVQALSFCRNGSEQKLEEAKVEAAEERSHNIQYAVMAVGVICFLVLILLLSRSVVVNERWISFLGVLGLLLLFEFVNLFIHPFLGSWTHHSPSLMFIALVAIAAVLVPMHHKVEHTILTRLTAKNKALRLAAARRTVAELEKEEPGGH